MRINVGMSERDALVDAITTAAIASPMETQGLLIGAILRVLSLD